MANRAFLMAHDSALPLTASESDDTIVAAASYQIPLLWLALFSVDSVVHVSLPMEDADGNESIAVVPALLAATAGAKSRYESLRPRLLAAVAPALHPHFAEWEALLRDVRAGFLQADVAEIWMMSEEGEFGEQLRGWLNGIAAGDGEGWADALGQANMPPTPGGEYDSAVARFGLRGYGWERPVPWSD